MIAKNPAANILFPETLTHQCLQFRPPPATTFNRRQQAADFWSEGRNGGYPHDDADLIIAAATLEAQRVLVTGNTAHYAWIPGLRLVDWRGATP